MINYNLVIELGSSNTVIYKVGLGVVLKEPSLIALQDNGKLKTVKAVGKDAKNLIGKTGPKVKILSPIKEGCIADLELAKIMLKEFLKKIENNKFFGLKQKLIFLVHCGINEKEKMMFKSLAYSLNFSFCEIVPSAIAGLIGMGFELNDNKSRMIVNIGGGGTDIAIVNGINIINGCTIDVGGIKLDEMIVSKIRETCGISVSVKTAENIKEEIGSLYANDYASMEVLGMDEATRSHKIATVLSSDIYSVIESVFTQIATAIEVLINVSTSEIVADINKYGVCLCGGTSKIAGCETFLNKLLKVPVYVDTDPESSVIFGGGALALNVAMVKQIVDEFMN